MERRVSSSARWHEVAKDLEAEQLKVASYDHVIFDRLKSVEGKRWLDYGSGPGVLALACKKLGVDVFTYDINPEMNQKCAEKIGKRRVFQKLREMRGQLFDIITCNLVLCIVTEKEVKHISEQIRKLLRKDGAALIGFCNPQIFDVRDTQLDYRFPTGNTYWEHHTIPKIKKEGGYRIFDNVRPISWYHDTFYEAGLEQTGLHVTPRYKMPNSDRSISDFVIFEETVV